MERCDGLWAALGREQRTRWRVLAKASIEAYLTWVGRQRA